MGWLRRLCGGWLETDNRAISVQLNLTGTATGTEIGNNNHNNHKNDNPHLNVVKGTVLGDKEPGVGIRDKG